MDWHASWIWHPPTGDADNFYLHARKRFLLDRAPADARLFITASSLYKLYVNGAYVGRGPNPADPSSYYYDEHDVSALLRPGPNVVAVLAYNYGPKAHGILGQNWGRGGLLVELRAAGDDRDAVLMSDGTWRVLQSPAWRQDAPVNCTLYGDFKEVYDSRLDPGAWTEPDFDDGAWPAAQVLGRPPLEPWTRLVPREIPFLGGERVRPVNTYWESASVTYSWRDDWEVYDEWSLAPGSARGRAGHVTRVSKTHPDFDPALVLDFGRDVTGYPEIAVADSSGGIVDVLYGEGLFLTRVDTFVLKGGRQVLEPFNRRTFRYMKLLFRETPAPVHVAEVSLRMDTYPVEHRGSFSCSDPLLDRIWDVGRHTMRLSMLDHFVDCPWRERTLYGGDMYPENLIAHYAFGDPRMSRKCLRQMAAIQYPEGALPPYGPYRGCDGFYPAWSAYWGLALLDHFELTGDRELLDELWPNLVGLLKWAIGQIENEVGLIAEPAGRALATEAEPDPFKRWLRADRTLHTAWSNLPFYVLLHRSGKLADAIGRPAEAARYGAAAEKMAGALMRHLVDAGTGLCMASARQPGRRPSDQYDNALLLWSGILPQGQGCSVARAALGPTAGGVGRITSPFHGLFVLEGLYRYGEGQLALDFMRQYWGEMLRRGATTCWEHFSLDWPPGVVPDRGISLCHGWSAAPTYALPAHVLGVRPIEPGFARFLVEPEPADLEWAAGEVPTPQGGVRLNWQRSPAAFRMELSVPDGCTARVSLPPVAQPYARATLDGKPAESARQGERAIMSVPAGRHVIELG